MDLGVLLLRILVAALLFGHSTQKLLGWFGGSGLTGTATVRVNRGTGRRAPPLCRTC